MKNLIKRLKNSPTYWQSLANYAERGWGLVYSLILARVILPEEFGTYALGSSIAFISSLLTRWEIGNLVRVESFYQGEGFNLAWTMTKVLYHIELVVLLAVVTLGYFCDLSRDVCLVVLVFGFFANLDKFANLLRSDLEGRSVFQYNFKVKLIFTPIAALITIPLAMNGWGVWALLSSSWVGCLVNWAVFRRANRRVIKKAPIEFQLYEQVFKSSFWQWLCFASNTLFVRGDKLMVGSVSSQAELGYYNRSYNYAPLSFLFLGAFAGGPASVAISKCETSKQIWRFYISRFKILVGSGLAVSLLWLFFSEQLVVLLFGKNWLFAAPYFKAFCLFGAIQGAFYLSCSLMQGTGHYRAQAFINIFSLGSAVVAFFTVNITGIEIVYLLQSSMILSVVLMVMFMVFALGSIHSK